MEHTIKDDWKVIAWAALACESYTHMVMPHQKSHDFCGLSKK